jgi:hypothetical protein
VGNEVALDCNSAENFDEAITTAEVELDVLGPLKQADSHNARYGENVHASAQSR